MIYFAPTFGHNIGMGHFFRLLGVFELFVSVPKFFLIGSDVSPSLLEKFKLPYTRVVSDPNAIVIFDGTDISTEMQKQMGKLQKANRIILDSLKNPDNFFGRVVLPSFYVTSSDIQKARNEFEKVSYGKEFFAIRESGHREIERTIVTVTFGGSDPNNLTSLIAPHVPYGSRVMIGPLFSEENKKEVMKFHQTHEIIEGSNETFSYIEKSEVVISALGTTVQEIEILQKKCILTWNHDKDQEDIMRIKNRAVNSENYRFLGRYNKFDPSSFKSALEELLSQPRRDIVFDKKSWINKNQLSWNDLVR